MQANEHDEKQHNVGNENSESSKFRALEVKQEAGVCLSRPRRAKLRLSGKQSRSKQVEMENSPAQCLRYYQV